MALSVHGGGEPAPGDAQGVGKVVRLYTKGWLPYTLRWQFRVTESRGLDGFTLESWGDFVGRGIWTFAQDGPFTDIAYDWRIRADKPLLRWLALSKSRSRQRSLVACKTAAALIDSARLSKDSVHAIGLLIIQLVETRQTYQADDRGRYWLDVAIITA